MSKMLLAGVVSLLAASTSVLAVDSVTAVDWQTDVLFLPSLNWKSTVDSPCGTPDYYTSTVNSTVIVPFIGNKVVVDGMQNNASGVLLVAVDDEEPFTQNLFSEDVRCGNLFTYELGNGTHTMSLTLRGATVTGNEGNTTQPVLHLTSITYYVPLADNSESSAGTETATSVPTISPSRKVHVDAIVGAVVGCVVGVILLGGVIFFVHRRRTKGSRHVFDPRANSTANTTEISSRSLATPGAATKLPPYARMEDDYDDKKPQLDVPSLRYTPSSDGLRARSRSPMPDRKSMP
ncbi:hypothetical protein PHLCEN_2v6832 [Hermanssonia centrifuga]|uniref:Mid2 domain-containing protein n=1 Tax=Hermanssonia centrifuga TaxID=98765 RepID=A0A2R6NYA4_9APHY|nr:hypothetical protein PHLCEN_2v6832 [Hermanssonia centrifuga]